MNITIENRKFKTGPTGHEIEHELKSIGSVHIEDLGAGGFHLHTKVNVLYFDINDFSVNNRLFETVEELNNYLNLI